MIISNLSIKKSNGIATVSVAVESKGNECELWFSTPVEFEHHLCSSRMDAFLVGLLYPAMQNGEDIIIKGCVSRKLVFNINNYVVPLLMSYSSTAKKIKVKASNLTSERLKGNGVGTGFSGGVDSFSTIYDRLHKETDNEFRINSFLFLNVGSHGFDLNISQSKFMKRYDYLSRFPKKVGLDFIPLDSNLHQFHPWGHQETHTLTSVAGVLALQNLFRKYYYSSSGLNYSEIVRSAYRYKNIDVGVFCDPILLPLLSTETTEFLLDGAADTRTDKILNIAKYEPSYEFLNVCVSGDDTHKNCSACSKCLRTLLALDLSNNLNQYSHLFDLEKYRVLKQKYILEQVATQNKNSFSKSNLDLANEMGVKLPNRLFSKLHYFINTQAKLVLSKTVKHISPSLHKKLKDKLN